jgi:hypothetical protein
LHCRIISRPGRTFRPLSRSHAWHWTVSSFRLGTKPGRNQLLCSFQTDRREPAAEFSSASQWNVPECRGRPAHERGGQSPGALASSCISVTRHRLRSWQPYFLIQHSRNYLLIGQWHCITLAQNSQSRETTVLSDEALARPSPFLLTGLRGSADFGIVKSSQFGRFPWDADIGLINMSTQGVVSFHVTKSRFARHVRCSTAAFEKASVARLKFVIVHI